MPTATRSGAAPGILGRPARVRIRSAALHAWYREHWHRPEHELRAHPFALDVAELDAPPPALDGAADVARLLGLELPWTVADARAEYRQDAASGVRVEVGSAGASVRAWGVPPPGTASLPYWGALHVAFHEALRASGMLPVHAAVLARAGRAVALIGPGGAGKSTTLLRSAAAAGSGWSILSEDFSWLDPHSLVLHGWDRGLRLWPGTIARFAPELAAARWHSDERGKRFLPWADLGVPVERAARLDDVLRIARAADHPAAPPQPREALRMLWEMVGMPLLPVVRRRVAGTVAVLLGRIRFAQHRLGETVSAVR